MIRTNRSAIGFALVFGCLVQPFSSAHSADPSSSIRQFDIPTVEKLGQQIYLQDREAWRATDILFAAHSRESLVAQKAHGWIVDSFPDRDVVRFIRDGANGPEAAYDVTFPKNENGSLSEPENRALTADELGQYNARTTALKDVDRPCGDNYNTVVLKDPQSDGWIVWVLAATKKPDAAILAGHYRFMVSKD